MTATPRSLCILDDYAVRLHAADPKCTEPIPVTPEEAFAIQERILKGRRLTPSNCFNVEEMRLCGHRVKVIS